MINTRCKKNPLELLELKNTISEMESSADRVNSRLDVAEEKIRERVTETIQMKHSGKNSRLAGKRASVMCGTLSGSLIYVHLESRTGG